MGWISIWDKSIWLLVLPAVSFTEWKAVWYPSGSAAKGKHSCTKNLLLKISANIKVNWWPYPKLSSGAPRGVPGLVLQPYQLEIFYWDSEKLSPMLHKLRVSNGSLDWMLTSTAAYIFMEVSFLSEVAAHAVHSTKNRVYFTEGVIH